MAMFRQLRDSLPLRGPDNFRFADDLGVITFVLMGSVETGQTVT